LKSFLENEADSSVTQHTRENGIIIVIIIEEIRNEEIRNEEIRNEEIID
jgi:predicted N-formylglutamate amidohydrolase